MTDGERHRGRTLSRPKSAASIRHTPRTSETEAMTTVPSYGTTQLSRETRWRCTRSELHQLLVQGLDLWILTWWERTSEV